MKVEIEKVILLIAAIFALFSAQVFMFILLLGFAYLWEDSKWPAFDSKNHDNKMMNGPLKPWHKGI